MIGLVLVAPFLLWTATGLLFLVKPGWRGAYEPLAAYRDEAFDPAGVVPLSLVMGKPGEEGAATFAELAPTAIGLVYVLSGRGASRVIDARTGAVLSPLSREAAERVALDATSRSKSPERYGEVTATRDDGSDVVEIDFAGGATVAVGRNDLSLSQYGADTARIDALYRIHYLQWTGVAAFDRPFAVLAIVATWVLAGLGLALFRGRPSES